MKKNIKVLLLVLTVVFVFMASFATLTQAATDPKLKVKAVTAIGTQPGYSPKNTIDGIDWTGGYAAWSNKDMDNRWSANGKGQWVKYQLTKIATVTSIEIAWHNPFGQVTQFEAYTSTNNKTWTKVIAKRASHVKKPKKEDNFVNQIYTIKPTKALYVKIVGYGNDSAQWGGWNSIRETIIHGK